MTDWGRGGPSGSLSRWVSKEVREQLRSNPLAVAARYSWQRRLLRRLFALRSFGRYIALYLLLDVVLVTVESLWPLLFINGLFPWASSPGAVELAKSLPGYLIGAQVGIIGVISLALALVTLIAQRDESSADVQVYYHESLFFEITASSLALVAVLAFQFIWPLQSLLHLVTEGGTEAGLFRFIFLLVHLGWFLLNLAAVAHFITLTFRFVQRGARASIRESYTSNILLPRELAERILNVLYRMAGAEAVQAKPGRLQTAVFGHGALEPYSSEISTRFKHPMRLRNVHVRLAHWAIRRWKRRCDIVAASVDQPEGAAARPIRATREPTLWFLPRPDGIMRGETHWCRRKDGVPLDTIEKFALILAFRFERARDGD